MPSPSNGFSGAKSGSAPPDDQDVEAEIRAANLEFGQRVGRALELPLTLLTAQRDAAIRAAHEARVQAEQERASMLEEQDLFIAFLMTEHDTELAETRHRLQASHAELERCRALAAAQTPVAAVSDSSAKQALRAAEEQLAALRESLRAAYAETDEARGESSRVQAERDEAVAESNDLKFECRKQVEAAQDEVTRLTWQLDEARRKLEDARDQARDEAYRLTELLTEVRRELDERNEEVRRLRACMTELDQEILSRPPPAAAVELEGARREVQALRHRLIDAKRDQSRLAHELELSRARRRVVISVPQLAGDELHGKPAAR